MFENLWNATPRVAGLLAPVFALRHAYDMGIGDTEAVIKTLEFCHRRRIGLFQMLPINETGYDNSPYGAISSVALDWLTLSLDPERVPGLSPVDIARIEPARLARLRSGRVCYPDVRALKLELLRKAYEQFRQGRNSHSRDRNSFERFVEDNDDWLPQYTLFRTLMHSFGTSNWMNWGERYSDYETALATVSLDEGVQEQRRFWSYVQWLTDRQWLKVRKRARQLGIRLMGDVPFGVNIFSADVWAWRNLFDLDWSGGAPPEPFFSGDDFTRLKGQNWGIAVYRWSEHQKDGYGWWARRLSRAARIFDFNRFDHILGVFRIYGFPWHPLRNGEFTHLDNAEIAARMGGRIPQFLPRDDYPAEQGELNRADGMAILQALCSAASDAKSALAGEDLGCVPDYVRPALDELGVPGFSIPLWRRAADQSILPSDTIPRLSVATYSTHDHPPLATSYGRMVERWHGPDGHEGWLEMRRVMSFLGRDPEKPPVVLDDQLLSDFWRSLLSCPSVASVFIVSDLLGTTHQFNEPASGSDSNWTARLEKELQEYELDPVFGPRLNRFTELVEACGRATTG